MYRTYTSSAGIICGFCENCNNNKKKHGFHFIDFVQVYIFTQQLACYTRLSTIKET